MSLDVYRTRLRYFRFPAVFLSTTKSFEVFDLHGKEFALARTEKKIGRGHKNFEITIGKNITIEEDLKRRDITINAIAKDVLTGEIRAQLNHAAIFPASHYVVSQDSMKWLMEL